jgi:hypothetical protein
MNYRSMKKTLVLPTVQVSSSGTTATHRNTNSPVVKYSFVLGGLLKRAQSERGWLRAVFALAAPLAFSVPAAAERSDFLDRPSYQRSSRELSAVGPCRGIKLNGKCGRLSTSSRFRKGRCTS